MKWWQRVRVDVFLALIAPARLWTKLCAWMLRFDVEETMEMPGDRE